MKVLKFGGTSIGNSERILNVAKIVAETKGHLIIVLSAMSGVTDTLLNICAFHQKGMKKQVYCMTSELEKKHIVVMKQTVRCSKQHLQFATRRKRLFCLYNCRSFRCNRSSNLD